MVNESTRRKITKAERMAVFDKTKGYCAYCGCQLTYDKMQVDYIISLRNGGVDAIGNMLPACRSCNQYKAGNTLEGFRHMVESMPSVLMRDNTTYRNAVRFGLIIPKPVKVIFYFERIGVLHS